MIESPVPYLLHWKPAKSKKKIKLGVDLGQNLGQLMSKCCGKSKETGNIIYFFHILLGNYLLKQKTVIVKPPEWKYMAIIARNAKF